MIEDFLQRTIKVGDLTIHLPGGRTMRVGDGAAPTVAIRVNAKAVRGILAKPSLGVGEAYMNGDLVLEQGNMWELLEIAGRSGARAPKPRRDSWAQRLKREFKRGRQQANSRAAARRNVAHHYDLSNELYRRFLDADLQYSCAYFERPDMTLEDAQAAKKKHIADKLMIRPGQTVLDIGSGWGGLAMTLARDYGAKVTGVTLSTEQLELARERVRAAGLDGHVDFQLTDYRDVDRKFDRIVSVGMLEHVGAPHLYEYFATVKRLLTDDGVALIHSIGRMDGPKVTDAFTHKYIFPGCYVPAVSEIVKPVEEVGLWITDMEVLRLHYALTLRHWRERFLADPEIPNLYDARFRRMWEFYLAGSEMGFRYGGHMNVQIQLAKRRDAVPITRDYMGPEASGRG
ncbi:MAG: class I SAM-dependent methyltransferase [Phenylobacterium sp.]|uniref:SAM-dependent methyltransferase n=1 Tax=Phenylobacterium sp. TaxID=1871053 RepID=UPI00120A9273|nr:cyclopropane-fatty-acyl-phospholipid synthase family protein [Phenylobacterium sp.]TAJ70745.1 MAG: class I SAM-dependent methyltransferase [Phenylobacterium sp.]